LGGEIFRKKSRAGPIAPIAENCAAFAVLMRISFDNQARNALRYASSEGRENGKSVALRIDVTTYDRQVAACAHAPYFFA